LAQLPDGVFARPPRLTPFEMRFRKTVHSRWQERRVIVSRGLPLHCRRSGSVDSSWPPKCSLNNTLPSALATGRVILRPNSIVSHLIVDTDTARVAGVSYLDRITKSSFEVFARIVVLCASNIESVRIMLNSRSRQHPRGVGNSSGLLGRYLIDHMAVFLAGTIAQARAKTYPLGGAHGICIPRFRNLDFAGATFIRGYGIWGGIQRGPAAKSGLPQWVLVSQLEAIPQEQNRIEIDSTVADAWGVNVVRISFSYSDNEHHMKEDAKAAMLEMAMAAELDPGYYHVTLPGQYVHEMGGARMGTTPSGSVLNCFNQCWDASNLFVLDGSCFVTSGWQNPGLTMMALAVRGCSFIVESLKRNEL
jgi:choline dehydrogenase-like flavoprotein